MIIIFKDLIDRVDWGLYFSLSIRKFVCVSVSLSLFHDDGHTPLPTVILLYLEATT